MIFNIKTSLEILGLKYRDINMSLSFCAGDDEFYDVISYGFCSHLNKIIVSCEGVVCSDSYLNLSTFDKSEFDTFLSELMNRGVGEVRNILHSLPSYKVLKSGKPEDFNDNSDEDSIPTEDGLLTKKEVEDELWRICKEMASHYNEGEDYWETNANGYYVNREEQTVEFEFTVMNDKFWDDIPFDIVKDTHGLDIEFYQDYFKN